MTLRYWAAAYSNNVAASATLRRLRAPGGMARCYSRNWLSATKTRFGIAPGNLSRLGDPFFQGRSSYDRTFEGTGLGLSLVRGLVGLHGGSLRLESALEEGTRVTVRLPIQGPKKPLEEAAPAAIETLARVARTKPGRPSGTPSPPSMQHAAREKKIA